MKKNFIIQAHKSPSQLSQLINILNDENSSFFIHVDLKTDMEPFMKCIKQKNVFFLSNRINCIWGDYSQVLVTINLIEEVLKKTNEGIIIFLSGQDYPIKSNFEINNFFKNNHSNFIRFDSFDEPINKDDGQFYKRLTNYRINISSKRGDFILLPPILECNISQIKKYLKLILFGNISISQFFTFFKKRKAFFCQNKHYRGHNWWCIRNEIIQKIYIYYKQNKKEIDKYYKYTHCADEQFFHTIYKQVINNSDKTSDFLHYIDWNKKNVPLPVTFTSDDINILLSQPNHKLFARKFDIETDSEILNLIDKNIR